MNNNNNIPQEISHLQGKPLVDAVASMTPPLPPETIEALLWRLDGWYLVQAGRTWPGLTGEMLAPHLVRLTGDLLARACYMWPGLTADDLHPLALKQFLAE